MKITHCADIREGETEDSSIEPVTYYTLSTTTTSSTTTKTTTSATTASTEADLEADSWTKGIGTHFAQIADEFAQSISKYRVLYATPSEASVASSSVCPKLGQDQACARQSARNECWPEGICYSHFSNGAIISIKGKI
jgi:hypothetical protein